MQIFYEGVAYWDNLLFVKIVRAQHAVPLQYYIVFFNSYRLTEVNLKHDASLESASTNQK